MKGGIFVAKEKKTTKQRQAPPATTIDAREQQLIALATNLAEQQLRDGTASSQVMSIYLKLGTTREREEREILEKQKELMTAKTEQLQSSKRLEALYADAIGAFKIYNGQSEEDDGDDDYDD